MRVVYLPSVFVSGGCQCQENEYQVHQGNWPVIVGVHINVWFDVKSACLDWSCTENRELKEPLGAAAQLSTAGFCITTGFQAGGATFCEEQAAVAVLFS